jgi:hypothetical protein
MRIFRRKDRKKAKRKMLQPGNSNSGNRNRRGIQGANNWQLV